MQTDTYTDHVMNSVDIGVTHVDPDSPQRKSQPPPRTVNDYRRPETTDADGQVPTGR